MKIDDYFEKAAKDPSYRAEQISNASFMAKFGLWGGWSFFAFWAVAAFYSLSAERRLPEAILFLPVLMGFGIYERESMKVGALRALDRQNPPA